MTTLLKPTGLHESGGDSIVMKIRFFRVLMLTVLVTALTGCMVFRVTQKDHDEEVSNMRLAGIQFKVAVAKVEAVGFSCRGLQDPPRNRPGKQPTLEALCFKRTPELWCPQERRISFDAEAQSGIVTNVETLIIDRSCW